MPGKRSLNDYFQNITIHLPQPGPGLGGVLRYQLRELVAAVRFLTILPVPGTAQLFNTTEEEEESSIIVGAAYFPLVGLLLAALLWLLLFLTNALLPPLVLAALLVMAQTALTGGLHLDGLMDSCDGLFGGRTVERKLEIMRDSRVGSFGVLGGACILLFKFAAIASMRVNLLTVALFMVLPAARWGMILAVGLYPTTRLSGLGYAFRSTITGPRLLFAGITALVIVLIVGHLAGLLVWLVSMVVALVVGTLINRQLGGLTGDSYGAIEEITEVALLLLIILLHFWF